MTPVFIRTIVAIAVIVLLGTIAVYGVADAQVTSTRVSAFDWQCQDANGNRLSDHQRFDTAFVACLNNPAGRFVQGGRYEIVKASVPDSGTANVSWTPPTQCADGSAITNCPVTGYRIAYGRAADTLTEVLDVSAGTTSRAFTGLASGQWYFAVLALSANGTSAPSEVLSKTVN